MPGMAPDILAQLLGAGALGMGMNKPDPMAGMHKELLDSGVKDLKKVQQQQIQEAVAQGVPAEHIIKQLIQQYPAAMAATTASAIAASAVPSQQGQQPIRPTPPNNPNPQPNAAIANDTGSNMGGTPAELILSELIQQAAGQQAPMNQQVQNPSQVPQQQVQLGNIMPPKSTMAKAEIDPTTGDVYQAGWLQRLIGSSRTPEQLLNMRTTMTNEALQRQKFYGQEPLQKGEREKAGIEGMQKLEQEMAKSQADMGKPLPTEAAMKFGMLLEGRDAVVEASSLLDSVGANWNNVVPNFARSPEGQLFDSAIERMIQAKTRAETGAAMPASDLKNTLKRYAPRKGESLAVFKRRVEPLFNYFNQSIAVVDPSGIHQQRARGAGQQFQQSQGQMSPAMQEAKRRGLI